MTALVVAFVALVAGQNNIYKDLSGRPHLLVEWWMAASLPKESKECVAAREAFHVAMTKRDWTSALVQSQKAIDSMDIDARNRASLELGRAEIFLLAGQTDDALKAAQPYLLPLESASGKEFRTVADYYAYSKTLGDRGQTAEEQKLSERFSYWRQFRASALNLTKEAFRMKGDPARALQALELLDADNHAMPPIEPPRDWEYLDRASQFAPLQAAVRSISDLEKLARMKYVPDPKLTVSPEEQQRLVAVFANITLGHDKRAHADPAGAKKCFLEAKTLIEGRVRTVNREMLQWLIVREELARLGASR